MTTSKNNESCNICGDPLCGGYVEMRRPNGEYQRMCFECAFKEMQNQIELTENEVEENDVRS